VSSCASCGAEVQSDWKFCVYCGTPALPGAIRPVVVARPRVNRFAIVAFVLGCLGGFPAFIFGHLALNQIRTSGERGLWLARIGTALGYFWLVVEIVAINIISRSVQF